MHLSITTTHRPATDLGYLLHKNPGRMHTTELSFGKAHLIFPHADEARCTATLVLDVDPVALVRGKGGREGLLTQYVNDRPYAATSFLAVAMGRTFREAVQGRSKERQALADALMPLDVTVAPLPARGGPEQVQRLFAPLGCDIRADPIPLDPRRPDWGASPYVRLTLRGTVRLADVLTYLVVLIPALDGQKHYYIGDDEVEKLLRRGEGWLETHPERDWIVSRYLRGRKSLIQDALARLTTTDTAEGAAEEAVDRATKDAREDGIETPLKLHDVRLDAVADVLKRLGVSRVLDLGCGEGKLIQRLVADKQFTEIVGVEVSSVSLARAASRREKLPEMQKARVKLLHGALLYRDTRLRGYDAAALVEVIEHIDPERLIHLERAVFGDASPRAVVVTTPNADYNVLFPTLPAGTFRHDDHRFEWSRAEFQAWADKTASTYGYTVELSPLGPEDATHGAPSQMAVFTR